MLPASACPGRSRATARPARRTGRAWGGIAGLTHVRRGFHNGMENEPLSAAGRAAGHPSGRLEAVPQRVELARELGRQLVAELREELADRLHLFLPLFPAGPAGPPPRPPGGGER